MRRAIVTGGTDSFILQPPAPFDYAIVTVSATPNLALIILHAQTLGKLALQPMIP
jgi:hypothetical protein